MTELIGVAMGGLLVLVAQWVTHHFARQRDERNDLIEAIERVIDAFVAGDQAATDLIVALRRAERREEEIQDAIGRLKNSDDEIVSARWAIELRGHWPLAESLRLHEDRYDAVVSTLARAAQTEDERELEEGVQLHDELQASLNEVMAMARAAIHRQPYIPPEAA